jgi:5-methylcytosine-specific restriction endonuclease McrA
VTAWSKGGATDRSNCELLCKSHNRAKGNRWLVPAFLCAIYK